jgi:hypothetical protein
MRPPAAKAFELARTCRDFAVDSFPTRRNTSPSRFKMKIDQIICQILRVRAVEKKTASSQDVVLVRVRADNGLEGIGEADASPEVVKAIIDAPFSHNIACGLREILVGENPLETERLFAFSDANPKCRGEASIEVRIPDVDDSAREVGVEVEVEESGHPPLKDGTKSAQRDIAQRRGFIP